MPKEEWGVKRVCPTTGKRFYDLNRSPVISPYTGEVVPIDLPGRKFGAASAIEAMKSKAKPETDLDADDSLIDGVGVVIEDDELLEDEDESTVSFDEIADVSNEDEEI